MGLWRSVDTPGRSGPVPKRGASCPRGGGGVGMTPAMDCCLQLAAPIGLSPLLFLTLCGSERVLVVSMEPRGGGAGDSEKQKQKKTALAAWTPIVLLLLTQPVLEGPASSPARAATRGKGPAPPVLPVDPQVLCPVTIKHFFSQDARCVGGCMSRTAATLGLMPLSTSDPSSHPWHGVGGGFE